MVGRGVAVEMMHITGAEARYMHLYRTRTADNFLDCPHPSKIGSEEPIFATFPQGKAFLRLRRPLPPLRSDIAVPRMGFAATVA